MAQASAAGMIAAGGVRIVCAPRRSPPSPRRRARWSTAPRKALVAYVCPLDRRRVSAIDVLQRVPGFVRTAPGYAKVDRRCWRRMSDAALAAQQARISQPEEVARAALVPASDEASFVNGAHLFVDSCFTAVWPDRSPSFKADRACSTHMCYILVQTRLEARLMIFTLQQGKRFQVTLNLGFARAHCRQ